MADSLLQTDALVLAALVQAIEVDGQDFPDVHAIYATSASTSRPGDARSAASPKQEC